MSVKVKYLGRLGNNIFQYMAARAFAEQRGYALQTEFPWEQVVQVTAGKAGISKTNPEFYVTDDSNIFDSYRYTMPACYNFYGFYQKVKFYQDRRDYFKSFFNLEAQPENTEDLVAHLRLGDYFTSWNCESRVISPEWYVKLFSELKYKKLYIVSQTSDKRFKDAFKQFDPVWYVARDERTDWNFIRRFSRVIAGNSTFSWTAAFLGNAKLMYTFAKWVDHPSVDLQHVNFAISVKGEFLPYDKRCSPNVQ